MRPTASVGVYDAKTNLPKLLDRVAAGESIAITRYGQEVALLIPSPARAARGQDFKTAVARWRQARRGARLNGLKVRELINRGRR